MNILFVGGEDIDFNFGVNPVVANTTASSFRSAFSRCSLSTSGAGLYAVSNSFLGGAVTTCWLSCQLIHRDNGTSVAGMQLVGLVDNSTGSKGLWLGFHNTDRMKLGLYKYDGTTSTSLVQGSATVWLNEVAIALRIDLQLVSYGASATVNVYVNGSLYMTYSGDVTVSGVTNVNSVGITYIPGGSSQNGVSEVVVADSDTRAIQGVQTLALTGAGTTTDWTNNTYTNINGISFSDASPTSVNTTAKDQQYDVTDPSASSYSVAAVKISARMAKSSSPTPTQVKLGYNSGGTVGFGTGATKAVTTAYLTYEQIDQTNPVTAAAFTPSEITALQLDMQSA